MGVMQGVPKGSVQCRLLVKDGGCGRASGHRVLPGAVVLRLAVGAGRYC